MMETTGFTTFTIGDPLQGEVDEVEKVFAKSRKATASGITFCEGGNECKKFLHTDSEESEVKALSPAWNILAYPHRS